MADNQVTIIEVTADFLMLVILGEKKLINEFISDLNQINDIKYIAVKISDPIADKCYELNNENLNLNYIIDDGVESAQCYTYADGHDKNTYMIMTITTLNNINILSYPKFELDDDCDDPENIIIQWFKSTIKKVPYGIKKNIKLITIVGIESNILVISTQLKSKK
jgi:hypothetical protein